MKRFKRRVVFLATNLETLGMVPFFGSWPLQYKMLSVCPDSTRFTDENNLKYPDIGAKKYHNSWQQNYIMIVFDKFVNSS